VPDNRVDWRRRYDEMVEKQTPDHPDVPATVFEPTNGLNVAAALCESQCRICGATPK
jgi:hypothetical protein